MTDNWRTCHIREENGDYFLVRHPDHGTVYVALYIDVARYWEVYVAGTQVMVPVSQPVAEQVIREAYAYALQHSGDVTTGLTEDARGYVRRKDVLGNAATLVPGMVRPCAIAPPDYPDELDA